MRSLLALENERLGFDSSNLLVASVSFPPAATDNTQKTANAFATVIQRLKNLPGVQNVAATDAAPLSDGGADGSFSIEGRSDQKGGNKGYADWRLASENYFLTMKIPLLRGREFQASDRSGEKAVIVNETLAKKYWHGEDPLGKRIAIVGLDEQTLSASRKNSNIWFDIVGVVGDVATMPRACRQNQLCMCPIFRPAGSLTGWTSSCARLCLLPACVAPSIKKSRVPGRTLLLSWRATIRCI